MQKINITIHPLSYLLVSAGNGSGLIDSEMEFHKNGFPMLRAKAFKGLLRESLMEILEIKGEGIDIVTDLFGDEGYQPGKLKFPENFYPEKWENIKAVINMAKKPTPTQVKSYFTQVINQTKIANDGVADNTSLRTMGVLRPELNFTGAFYCNDEGMGDEQKNEIKGLLQLAFKNLRYCGRQRNRGLGRIKVSGSFESATEIENTNTDIANTENVSITITTLSPVVLTKRDANANTVFSNQVVTGSQLRGILANQFINEKKVNNAAYHPDDDEDFYNIFLSGKLKFCYSFPNGAMPLPQNWQGTKSEANKLENVFEKNDDEQGKNAERRFYRESYVTESETGFQKEKHTTTFNFHNSRHKNRIAGKSTKDEGAIYYYEAVDEGQSFTGQISGDKDSITKLFKTVKTDFDASLGKSKGVQYGRIHINAAALPDDNKVVNSTMFQVLVRTPVILLNDWGTPEASINLLQKAMQDICGDLKIEKEKVRMATTEVEQFVVLWQAKSGKKIAVKEGSTFIITCAEPVALKTQYWLGAMQEQGFGEVVISEYNPDDLHKELTLPQFDSSSIATGKPEIIDKIEKSTQQREHETQLKTIAIQKAVAANKDISNSFISQMIDIFSNAVNYDDVDKEIQSRDGKMFVKSLEKAKLLIKREINGQEMVGFYFEKFGIKKNEKFEDQQTFWLTFFKTLRLKSKDNEKSK